MLSTPKRNRYFRGKLLDAYHFDLEQSYFNRKRRTLNRLGLGTGILDGLEVKVLPDSGALQIQPGIAIDALGREIILSKPSPPFDPRALTDADGNPTQQRLEGSGTVLVALLYRECETELAPVLDSDCHSETVCAASIVEERYAVAVREFDASTDISLGMPGWLQPGGTLGRSEAVRRLIEEALQEMSSESGQGLAGWIKALEKLSDFSPLFTSPEDGTTPQPGVLVANVALPQGAEEIKVDGSIRRELQSNEQIFELLLPLLSLVPHLGTTTSPLTTIEKISWTHGGVKDTEWLAREKGGIRVTFSKPIPSLPRDKGWFSVTLDYSVPRPSLDLEFPSPDPELAFGTLISQRALFDCHLESRGEVLVLTPDANFVSTFKRTCEKLGCKQVGALCRIAIKCDHLRDEDSRRIDGDYFGTLPSGDGLEGGDFESWFTLLPIARPMIP